MTIEYVGYDYRTGRSTGVAGDNRTADFELTNGFVLDGLRKGIVGMRAGGRRELIIPPNLAFGSDGAPPKIAPNATVVYVVDLLEVEPGR